MTPAVALACGSGGRMAIGVPVQRPISAAGARFLGRSGAAPRRMLRGMRPHLQSRHLYIADLAGRLHRMETGQTPLQPLAYKLFAKRLRQALAGVAEPLVRAGLPELPAPLLPLLIDTLEARHFEHYGQLFGVWSAHSGAEARALLRRLMPPPVLPPQRGPRPAV